ncbi:hypothetical protein N7478_010597 [Penicillium angulare]|uniref:uncharacterized protein n=1 Tax=Penicillium angulare TaxID=116970 RepID=UPI0025402A43|nr:uncharacterized protein N7478_010597 [Penicillium angulare]KAJ5267789.1 hypothetical protein N7478_010597 [Penicillium angulare]
MRAHRGIFYTIATITRGGCCAVLNIEIPSTVSAAEDWSLAPQRGACTLLKDHGKTMVATKTLQYRAKFDRADFVPRKP